VTGWTLLSVVMGLVLWWPKTWKTVRGVLWLRWDGKRYVVWRDVHAVAGAAAAAVVLISTGTGLLYTLIWGSAYHGVAFATGQYDLLLDPPKSVATASETLAEIGPDEALAAAVAGGPVPARISLNLPSADDDSFAVESGGHFGPSLTSITYIDRYDGSVILRAALADAGPLAQWTQWNYPLHVGSIGGTATKVIWAVAVFVVACLPITGIAMYLIRRKPGKSALPRRIAFPGGRAATAAVVAVGCLLPAVGVSLLTVALIDFCRRRLSRSGRVPNPV
ncbi:MAG: PepSY domain-containing protein, partial [Planctomycetota bacterium]